MSWTVFWFIQVFNQRRIEAIMKKKKNLKENFLYRREGHEFCYFWLIILLRHGGFVSRDWNRDSVDIRPWQARNSWQVSTKCQNFNQISKSLDQSVEMSWPKCRESQQYVGIDSWPKEGINSSRQRIDGL